MLGHLGGRRLGLDGGGAATDQGHGRRGAGLALGDGVVVGDDEPVAAGQLGRRVRVKGHGSCAGIANRTSKLCRQRGRYVSVGIHPFGSLLCPRCRAIEPRIMKHGENSLTNGVFRPRYVSCDFLVGISIVGNDRRKELIRVIPRRNFTVHRNSSGTDSMSRPGQHHKREDGNRGYRRDSQQAAAKPTHDGHLDPDRDDDEHASTSRQNTASKRRPDTS